MSPSTNMQLLTVTEQSRKTVDLRCIVTCFGAFLAITGLYAYSHHVSRDQQLHALGLSSTTSVVHAQRTLATSKPFVRRAGYGDQSNVEMQPRVPQTDGQSSSSSISTNQVLSTSSAGFLLLGLSAAFALAAQYLKSLVPKPEPSATAMFALSGTRLPPLGSVSTMERPAFHGRSSPPTLAPSFMSHTHSTGRRSTALNALKTGIVGLPNVGKSTLFNALTGGVTAEAANYPFCTIDPNVGIVEVPDKRLTVLTEISQSEKTLPATLEFVDIAGIVKGASKGEGMGNKFLSNIRECDAIVHVVRCFKDDNVIHVNGKVDPVDDMDVINLELVFADLEQVEKRLERARKDRKASEIEKQALEKAYAVLEEGRPARAAGLTEEEWFSIKSLGLLTGKKMIYAANVPEEDLAEGNEMVKKVKAMADEQGCSVILVSAQLEAELVELEREERIEMLESVGVDEENCGLKALVREAYKVLGLQTYFTTGKTETRAWTIKVGYTAPQAAGVIHGDFERGFIRAETISYNDLVECGSEKDAKAAGKVRSEGKDYVVQEADCMHFLFNVS